MQKGTWLACVISLCVAVSTGRAQVPGSPDAGLMVQNVQTVQATPVVPGAGVPNGAVGQPRPTLPAPPAAAPPLAPVQSPSSMTKQGSARSTMPLPPTATEGGSSFGSSAGWVAGGPFPAYMMGYSQEMGGSLPRSQPVQTQKPFSTYNRPPSVSPYLNLYRSGSTNGMGAVGNYYTLVRPMLNQQRTNQAVTRSLQQLQSGAARGASAAPGGYFMNYYGYFQGLR